MLGAVAVHGDRVVVTYDCASVFGSYTSYYYIGNFTTDRTGIQWEPKNAKLFGATETSVAVNEQNIVVAGRGWKSIMCCVGQFHGNAIEFNREIPLNHVGYCPTVCLDDDGYIIMVWQSTTLRKLNYVIANIPDPERPSITWPQHDSMVYIRSYDYGYNPTIAISPVGGHVIEEHETNFSLHRCRIHYHTGILEKSRLQGQAPQREQVLEQEQSQEEPQPQLLPEQVLKQEQVHEKEQSQEEPQPQLTPEQVHEQEQSQEEPLPQLTPEQVLKQEQSQEEPQPQGGEQENQIYVMTKQFIQV